MFPQDDTIDADDLSGRDLANIVSRLHQR